MNSSGVLLVIGAGCAGVELAFSARAEGWTGEVVLIGAEAGLPYQRPVLSKGYLAGAVTVTDIGVKSASAYDRANIRLHCGVSAQSIDRAAQTVTLSDGSMLGYDRMALATGGRARSLPGVSGGLDRAENIHYLRTFADASRIKSQLQSECRLVIVGGGYIGLEVAAVAVNIGLNVVVIEADQRVLARVTAPSVSAFYERVHRSRGVDIRTGVNVVGFELDAAGGTVTAVACSDHTCLPVDLVVVGIGQMPDLELAVSAGLATEDGILVDTHACTSDPLIVAAGDCARFYSALYGRSIRLESVPNAVEQARVAAANLCGSSRHYDPVPWFWSDQYDLKLRMVGLSAGYDQLVLRGRPESGAFSAIYLRDRHIIAVDTINRIGDFVDARRLVGGRFVVEPDALADESMPLAGLCADSSEYCRGPDSRRD